MSFLELLYIWLGVLFVAIVCGSVAHMMDRHASVHDHGRE
jgi:hypothetical protein